jgi:aminoglycoside phosphotransferase
MAGPVQDTELPAVGVLMAREAAAALGPAIGGGKLVLFRPSFVNYNPGEDIVVTYAAVVERSGSKYDEQLVAVARHTPPPEGALPSEAGGMPIGVWRYPHDPSLPGLVHALRHDFVAELLEEAGLPSQSFQIHQRGYSPRSRAVFEVLTRPADKLVFKPGVGLEKPRPRTLLYLKVRRPSRAREVHRAHELLAERLTAPRVLAYREDLGILALEPLDGDPLWDAVRRGRYEPPEPERLIDLLTGIEDVEMERRGRATTSASVRWNAAMLRQIVPERADAVERFVEDLGEDPPQPEVTIHGDFHEVQVLVEPDRIAGVLDLDDAGRGQRVDDLAMMAGRMYQYMHTEPDAAGRVVAYTEKMMEVFGEHAGHEDFRRRVAGVALNHATTPFRFQESGWPGKVREHIDRATALLGRVARR